LLRKRRETNGNRQDKSARKAEAATDREVFIESGKKGGWEDEVEVCEEVVVTAFLMFESLVYCLERQGVACPQGDTSAQEMQVPLPLGKSKDPESGATLTKYPAVSHISEGG
jgi:hypothetical protein